MTSTTATSVAKVLQTDFGKFSIDSASAFDENPSGPNRKVKYVPGPAMQLCCDQLIQLKIEEMTSSGNDCEFAPVVIERSDMDSRLLCSVV